MRHPEFEELAAYVEARLGPSEAEVVRLHLLQCRRCASAYAETARFQAETEMALAEAPVPSRGRVRPQWRRPAAAAALAAVLAVAVGVGVFQGRLSSVGRLDAPLHETFVQARQRASQHALVLPGANADGTDLRYRAGNGPTDLDGVVEGLRRFHRADPTDADRTVDLSTALLLDTNPRAAIALVQNALRHHPDHRELRMMEAVLSYGLSDLSRAEERLRAMQEKWPRDEVVALNLSLVLAEAGQREEARQLLEQLSAEGRAMPVRERARRELE